MNGPVTIIPGITSVGVQNPDLRVFDIVMRTPFGTSYNAYLVQGSSATALIETVKDKFLPGLLSSIRETIGNKPIDYIVMNHTEPDHTGAALELWKEHYPNARFIGTKTNGTFLRQIANAELPHRAVSEGETLDLGGITLRFIMAPFLHWPDTMFTYIPENGTLFTCDFLGAHYSDPRVLDSAVPDDILKGDYARAFEFYFRSIMSPFLPHVRSALDKLDKLNIGTVCTGHGLVLTKDIPRYLALYRDWSRNIPPRDEVVIPYVSAYGYTREIATAIAEGISQDGRLKTSLYDMVYNDEESFRKRLSSVAEEIRACRAFLLGSPTIVGDALPPMWDLLSALNPFIHGGKTAGTFGSYGWSGEAVRNMEERLKQLRFKLPLPPFRVNFKPSVEDLEKARAFGKSFAEAVLGIETSQAAAAPAAPAAAEADKKNKTRFWRCVVCGEVFEGEHPPEPCPACGAGIEMFVPAEESAPVSAVKRDVRILIIGGGAAADSAARSARAANPGASITMLSAEAFRPYYRPILSDLLIDPTAQDKPNFYLHPESWYFDNHIELKLSEKALSINAHERSVRTSRGVYTYDRLILANGSFPFVPLPEEEWKDKPGVFTLRSLSDAVSIMEVLPYAKSAIVIGGGVLGLEAADALSERGLAVSIVEFMPRILPLQLDRAGSAYLESVITARGVKLYTGQSATGLLTENAIHTVTLSGGMKLSADLVLFSVGTRPDLTLARSAGLDCGRGITVNERMETSVEYIYACGDTAEYKGRCGMLWMPALAQGKTAGVNAAGGNAVFTADTAPTLLNAFGAQVYSAGDTGKDGDARYGYEGMPAASGNVYKKLVFFEGRLCGAMLINALALSVKTLAAVKAGVEKPEALKLLD